MSLTNTENLQLKSLLQQLGMESLENEIIDVYKLNKPLIKSRMGCLAASVLNVGRLNQVPIAISDVSNGLQLSENQIGKYLKKFGELPKSNDATIYFERLIQPFSIQNKREIIPLAKFIYSQINVSNQNPKVIAILCILFAIGSFCFELKTINIDNEKQIDIFSKRTKSKVSKDLIELLCQQLSTSPSSIDRQYSKWQEALELKMKSIEILGDTSFFSKLHQYYLISNEF